VYDFTCFLLLQVTNITSIFSAAVVRWIHQTGMSYLFHRQNPNLSNPIQNDSQKSRPQHNYYNYLAPCRSSLDPQNSSSSANVLSNKHFGIVLSHNFFYFEGLEEVYRPQSARSSYSNYHASRPISYLHNNQVFSNQAVAQVPINTNRSSKRVRADLPRSGPGPGPGPSSFLAQGPPAYREGADSETAI